MQPVEIDMSVYPRTAQYNYFVGMHQPYMGVTANVDITYLRQAIKRKSLPLFLTLLYIISHAANSVPQLRQRVLNGRIVEYPWCATSHTVALSNGTFCYCRLSADMPLHGFIPYAVGEQEKAKFLCSLEDDSDSDSLFFISSLPGISFTSLIQPTPEPPDYNPRITIGAFFEDSGKILLPVSILANHALVDGQHVSAFYDNMKRFILTTTAEL